MKTITAKTAGALAISGVLLGMAMLAGCGNKGPLVKPSDIPPPAPAAPAPEATPAPATPASATPAPATPASGAG